MKKVQLKCENCLIEFSRSTAQFNQAVSRGRKHWFCSHDCHNQYSSRNKKYNIKICKNCKKEYLSYKDRDKNYFCKQSCYTEHRRKNKKLAKILCTNCNSVITRPYSEIYKNKSNFCSRRCSNIYHKQQRKVEINVNCSFCKNNLTRSNCDIKLSKSGFFFCNRSCAMKHYNINRPRGYNSSKLEKHILEHIRNYYPELSILPNDRTIIGLELDLYFPSLNLAIEINGPTHYKPIYGKKQFLRSLKNDAAKIQNCQSKGIQLLVINCSKMNTFTEPKAQLYLSQVLNAIEARIKP